LQLIIGFQWFPALGQSPWIFSAFPMFFSPPFLWKPVPGRNFHLHWPQPLAAYDLDVGAKLSGAMAYRVGKLMLCDFWWVVWNHGILWLSIQLGMSSSQLTHIFHRGRI
jgi:hypothetical protein